MNDAAFLFGPCVGRLCEHTQVAVADQEIAIRPNRYVPHRPHHARAGLYNFSVLIDHSESCGVAVRRHDAESLKADHGPHLRRTVVLVN